jgi:hypothetical protein
MKNTPLFTHIVAAIPVAITFLFQMATLERSINIYFGERIGLLKGERRTCGEQVRMRRRRGPGMQGPAGVTAGN